MRINDFSTFDQAFGEKLGAIVVLKPVLYGLKTTFNLFRNLFGESLIYICFTPSRSDQDLWLNKSDKDDRYDYISTHVYSISIATKNPFKYMNLIELMMY